VDADGHARITDFGGSAIIQGAGSTQSVSDNSDHAVRWAAPEIAGGSGIYSKEADVFSFAMLTIEVRYEWIVCINPWLTVISFTTGTYWGGSVRRSRTSEGYGGNRRWRAPASTPSDASGSARATAGPGGTRSGIRPMDERCVSP